MGWPNPAGTPMQQDGCNMLTFAKWQGLTNDNIRVHLNMTPSFLQHLAGNHKGVSISSYTHAHMQGSTQPIQHSHHFYTSFKGNQAGMLSKKTWTTMMYNKQHTETRILRTLNSITYRKTR